MARRGAPKEHRWWNEPPLWAWLVAAASVVLIGLVAAVGPEQPNVSRAELDRMDAAAAAADASDAAAQEATVRVLAIGDSYTGGSNEGGQGSFGWADLLAQDLDAPGRQVVIDEATAGGSGYVAVGPSGRDFVQLAGQAGEGYDVVVFFGSRNDTAGRGPVRAQAERAFAAAKASSPGARLLVIGPPWVNGNPPANILEASRGVKDAANAVGAAWLDPLADGWFTGRYEALIGSDNVHPTDEGHRYMADLIRPALEAAVGAPVA